MTKPTRARWMYVGLAMLLLGALAYTWRLRANPPLRTPGAVAVPACPLAPRCTCGVAWAAGENRSWVPADISVAVGQRAQEDTTSLVVRAERGETAALMEACDLALPELEQALDTASMRERCALSLNKRAERVGTEALTRACHAGDSSSCVLLAETIDDTDDSATSRMVALYKQACDLDNAAGCTKLAGQLEVEGKTDMALALYEKACNLGRDEQGMGSYGCQAVGEHKLITAKSAEDTRAALTFYAKACYRGARSFRDGPDWSFGSCSDLMQRIVSGEIQLQP